MQNVNTNVNEYVIVMTSCEYFQAVEIGNTTGPKKSGILLKYAHNASTVYVTHVCSKKL